ncbi:predicted membrane protein [Hahella chejuensis KCTC 2396]|uniref:Predicted membrane protein n=1 Tax=Hahella chejuensis (strain KCTC 2396) TaxID=349521 RepID=Q2SD62_HAHCH|nr:putative sulfate exporter family transporter [Hahella chejuensis]ABC31412.1 predicted membrane protein [Hahella chejuensis KCTC 2396]
MLIRLVALAVCAILLAQLPFIAALGLSALPLASLLGLLYGAAATHDTHSDVAILNFCQQKLLRLGIILFGFNLSFQQIAAIGWRTVLLDAVVIISVLSTGIYLGVKLLRLPKEIATLTAIGSAVCGAAAIMAAEPVVRAKEQDVAVAVGTVVVFGTMAMFIYPVIYRFTLMEPSLFGIYIGSTVHEVAQAVAAGQSISGEAMQFAVVAKLVRVMLLAPVIIALSALLFRAPAGASSQTKIAIPWFVFGFIAAAAVNSLITLPEFVLESLRWTAQIALTLAMTALGVKTRWSAIRQAGIRPIALSCILFIVLLGGGFGLNIWMLEEAI